MNVPSSTAGTTLATDTRSIDSLRASAARDPKTAIKEAARQFEALFMQQLMKSMREATMASGMLDNEGSKLGTEMLDSHLSTQMTGLPGGLADAIARQLERQMGGTADSAGTVPAKATPPSAAEVPAAGAQAAPVAKVSQTQTEFLHKHLNAALAAQSQTGIPATFMVAQAAHETGWGQRHIKNADGTPSHNLFGIKAGANWSGPVAEITTTEMVGGQARKVTAKFRAYGSDAESFADYAKLMKDSPRYAQAVASAGSAQGFAQGLQRAGYATDPAYADKLTRVINTTLRMQRAVT
jgi:peptidoglycan hydrolase FlgJ